MRGNAARFVMLITLWILAWGDVSWANVISGSLLATALLFAVPLGPPAEVGRRITLIGLAKLLGYIAVQLVTANILMARIILNPKADIRTGVLAYKVRSPSPWTVTLISNIIALTPGTMTVEAIDGIIYVHFLPLTNPQSAYNSIARIEHFVVGFLGEPVRTPNRLSYGEVAE